MSINAEPALPFPAAFLTHFAPRLLVIFAGGKAVPVKSCTKGAAVEVEIFSVVVAVLFVVTASVPPFGADNVYKITFAPATKFCAAVNVTTAFLYVGIFNPVNV